MADARTNPERVIVEAADVQRITCTCGKWRCGHCGHQGTAMHPPPTHCTACGSPLSEALNSEHSHDKR